MACQGAQSSYEGVGLTEGAPTFANEVFTSHILVRSLPLKQAECRLQIRKRIRDGSGGQSGSQVAGGHGHGPQSQEKPVTAQHCEKQTTCFFSIGSEICVDFDRSTKFEKRKEAPYVFSGFQ